MAVAMCGVIRRSQSVNVWRYQTLPIRRREEEFCLVVERHTSPHISHWRVVENLRHLCHADRGLGYGHGKQLLWADGAQHVIHLKLHC